MEIGSNETKQRPLMVLADQTEAGQIFSRQLATLHYEPSCNLKGRLLQAAEDTPSAESTETRLICVEYTPRRAQRQD